VDLTNVLSLYRELGMMFEASKRFPLGKLHMDPDNRLRGREKEYTLVPSTDGSKESRICYINPASGVPDQTITYGYVTAFTYLHEKQHNRITDEVVRKYVKLQPVCGTLSYSKIPELYDHCLGITGTLDCKLMLRYCS